MSIIYVLLVNWKVWSRKLLRFVIHPADHFKGTIFPKFKKEKKRKKVSSYLGKSRTTVIIASTVAGSAAFLGLCFVFAFIVYRRKKGINGSYLLSRNISSDPSSKSDIEGGSLFGIPIFSYTELEEATNNFDSSKELGDGGFGTVYYGKLGDGREVAIKRLYEHNYRRVQQFMNEIKILTCLKHPQLADTQQMEKIIITVAQDGSADYTTVQEAIDAVPLSNTCRTVIRIAPGIYRQPVYVPKTKNFITLAGIRPEDTVLTWDNTATKIDHHQAERVIGTGTFGSGSTIVEGEDFIAENITFENSAPEGSGQAVAIRVTADRSVFYNCRFLGWQDTLYLHHGKQYLRDCYIEGSVDFIFGNSTALLEHCHIHCKSAGFVTAQNRKSSQETTGYVFLRCVITGNGETQYMHLGRPWGPFGRVVFAYTYMDACIKQVGWNNWGKPENERTACFYEYRCFGPGSCPSQRVEWTRELIEEEAEQFLAHSFVDPDPERPWLAPVMAARIPYSAM